jgi:hypothetical protein
MGALYPCGNILCRTSADESSFDDREPGVFTGRYPDGNEPVEPQFTGFEGHAPDR